MLNGQRIVVVMPAYHAEKTLETCYRAIPHDIVDVVLVVDDASDDATVAVAQSLGLKTHCHPLNLGYGANQKTCYSLALEEAADVVVMLIPTINTSRGSSRQWPRWSSPVFTIL